jgi:hypothetical protein
MPIRPDLQENLKMPFSPQPRGFRGSHCYHKYTAINQNKVKIKISVPASMELQTTAENS